MDEFSAAAAPALGVWDRQDLPALLTLEACGEHRFRSRYCDANTNRRAFGGQLLGQALWAAAQTVTELRPHAMQVLFLRGAAVDRPLDYEVEALLDGRRYAMRQVRGSQNGAASINAQVSFQRPSESPNQHAGHFDPAIPGPEGLLDLAQLDQHYREKLSSYGIRIPYKPCLDTRFVDGEQQLFQAGSTKARYWMKLRTPLPDDPLLHEAAFAYLSDYFLPQSSIAPHYAMAELGGVYIASLNHCIWFHAPCRADEWLLFDSHSPWAGNDRGLSQAQVYDRSGRLVASLTQECVFSERV